jgi:translation initiation factor IF-1
MTGLVYKSTGSWYTVKTDLGANYQCRIKGKFRMKDIKSTNPIAVGDVVDFELETKNEEIRGKTGLINFQTGNTGDRKAEKKLKMAAAEQGCAFILMTADKTTVGANSNALGGSQAIKKGIAYSY